MDEVIPGLWVGTREDARALPDPRRSLCVLEVKKHGPTLPEQFWVPILDYVDRPVDGCARGEALDRAAQVIHEQLPLGMFLVHCGIGVERSPLTIAWYLVRYRLAPSMDAAYKIVRKGRSIAQDRQHWLERQPVALGVS